MKIRIVIGQFFWNTEKLADFIQFTLFKTTMKYCVSVSIFMKNNAASWNVKVFRAKEGKKQSPLILVRP